MLILAVFYNNPDYYPPMINGAFVLNEHGIDQEIICRAFSQDFLPIGGVSYPTTTRITRLNPPVNNSFLAYIWFIWKVISTYRIDDTVIIGYDMHGLIPAWIMGKLYHRPIVYHSHDFVERTMAKSIGQRIVKLFERILVKTIDLVIVPDEERAEVMVDQLRLATSPLIVANAPRLAAKSSANRLDQELKKRGKDFKRLVLRQGKIGRGHALEVTIRSMPYWEDRDWGFVILGPGEANYKRSLEQLAIELGVTDRLVILPPVPYPEVAQFTGGAHLGHALYEPIHINNQYITMASNKILEYIAAGMPLLLSNTQGSHNLIDKYKNGLVADIESPMSIAGAINSILSDEVRLQEMGKNSRLAFNTELNYEFQYMRAIEEFRKLGELSSS